MRVLIDEIRKGKRNNARDNYASVAAPFHPDGVTVRVEATGRGHSASDESRIDAAFKENWESQRDRQLQDWTKGRDDQLKRLNDFIQSARKRIGLEREKLEKARQEGKGADYSALGYQRAIADYELRIERTQKVEIPRAEAYFRFSQARTNRDYAQALAAARELQKLAPLENELKVALTDRLWELEQAQLALLNKQEFRDRAVQRDKEVRQRLVGEHRRETIKCMNDLAWAGYFAGDFDAVREARTTLIDIYSKPESEQETDSQRNSREARLAGTLVTFATETATFTGDRRAAADLYTRGQKIYEQLRNKPWSPDTDPWLPGWWPDRQD